MPENIEQRVKDIIVKQLSVTPDQLTPTASFQGDLKADSLDLVEIIMAFEDEFGLTIPEDKAAGIKTLGDAIEHISALKEGREPVAAGHRASPSVVAPASVNPNSPKGSGSGAVVSSSGHIVTAAHVVKGASRVEVVTSGGTFAAKVLNCDETNDVALIKVERQFENFLPVARSGTVRLGQSVSTIGFPNIEIQGHSPKVTQGVISGENGIQNDIRLWQVSVPVQPGNSGGPLLDETGRLIGVVVASLGLKAVQATGSVPQNVNYAIKSAYLEPILGFHKLQIDQSEAGKAVQSFQDMVEIAQKSSVLIIVY